MINARRRGNALYLIISLAFLVGVSLALDSELNADSTAGGTYGFGSAAGGGGDGPNTWYYGVGTDGSDYASSTGFVATWEGGDNITCTIGGSLTKISFKIGTPAAGTDLKIGLYYDNAGTWTLVECVEVLNVVADSWNDATLVTPYTVTNGQSIMVKAIPNDACGFMYATTSGGHYRNSRTYGDECSSTTTWNNDYSYAVRVYVD